MRFSWHDQCFIETAEGILDGRAANHSLFICPQGSVYLQMWRFV